MDADISNDLHHLNNIIVENDYLGAKGFMNEIYQTLRNMIRGLREMSPKINIFESS